MTSPGPHRNPRSRRGLRGGALRLLRDSRGGTAVEYGFILALIVLALIPALSALAGTTVGFWNDISAKVQNAH